jgi:hypothetical protein
LLSRGTGVIHVIASVITAQGASMTTITEQIETAPASTEPKATQQPRAVKPGANVAPKRVKATFTIDSENNVTAHAGLPPAGANEPFANLKDLTRLTAKWPASRLVDVWNSFADVAPFDDLKPVKKFTNRDIALARIWDAVERLAPMVTPSPVAQPARDVEAAKQEATKPASRRESGATPRAAARSLPNVLRLPHATAARQPRYSNCCSVRAAQHRKNCKRPAAGSRIRCVASCPAPLGRRWA